MERKAFPGFASEGQENKISLGFIVTVGYTIGNFVLFVRDGDLLKDFFLFHQCIIDSGSVFPAWR